MRTNSQGNGPAGDGPAPEQPRFEPEIIPPGGDARAGSRGDGVFVYIDENGQPRQKRFKAPGTFTIVLTLLIVGIIAATLLVLVVGFVLVWIPIAVVAIAALLLAGRIRGAWRRFRGG